MSGLRVVSHDNYEAATENYGGVADLMKEKVLVVKPRRTLSNKSRMSWRDEILALGSPTSSVMIYGAFLVTLTNVTDKIKQTNQYPLLSTEVIVFTRVWFRILLPP